MSLPSLLFPEGTTTPGGAMEAARRTLDNTRKLANISLYEQRLHRHFRQIELELRELQLQRKQKKPPASPQNRGNTF